MKTRWEYVLLPSFLIVGLLIVASQYVFLKGSFFKDLGLGRISDTASMVNYLRFFTDSFYLHTLWITVKTSGLAALFTLTLGFPVAYLIARMQSKWSMILLAGIVVATFVTADEDDSTNTVTLSDTTNYSLGSGSDAGKVRGSYTHLTLPTTA